jgi:hypothetical protein
MLTIGGAGGQNGYIDIQDGKLILNGNRISQAASMIAAGQILSFGGDMDIIVRIEEGNTVLKSFVGDMDSNGIVNVDDLKLFAAQWLTDGNAAVSADFNSDDSVDMQDYSYIADNWLESIN